MNIETLTNTRLLELNKQGLIPGPDEKESEFIRRADYCMRLKEEFAAVYEDKMPFEEESRAAQPILEEAWPISLHYFDIAPHWTPLFFSNSKLPFWQGGCCWIFQKKETDPTAAFLQLRHDLKYQTHILGTYSRQELVAHEFAHIGRMMFEEPNFEELIAYQTAQSSFRRFFGPILRSSRETSLFLFVLLTLAILDGYLLFAGASLALFRSLLWLHLIPLLFIAYGLVRLIRSHRQFQSAKLRLEEMGLTAKTAYAILFRLTDQEIVSLGNSSSSDWVKQAEDQRQRSLRWRVIWLAYLDPNLKTCERLCAHSG